MARVSLDPVVQANCVIRELGEPCRRGPPRSLSVPFLHRTLQNPRLRRAFFPALQAPSLGEFNPSCLAPYVVSCVLNLNISPASGSSETRAGSCQVGFSALSHSRWDAHLRFLRSPPCAPLSEPLPIPLPGIPSPPNTPNLSPGGAVSTTEGLPGRVCAFKKCPITVATAHSPCWANGW